MAKQKLITKKIENTFKKFPLYSQDGKGDEAKVIVKFFLNNATWYITEGNLETGEMFGLCDLGMGSPELGYVNLNELRNVRGRFGQSIDRDRYFKGTIADAREELGAVAAFDA